MRQLVVVGNGHAADAFLRQIQRFRCDFSITVFSGPLNGSRPLRESVRYLSRGIDVRAGVSITAIDRHARLALGDDGSRTTFDRLILATGRGQVPRAGLAFRNGVIVNRSLETSDGHIYAIGDCAEMADAGFSASLERLARNLAARLVAEAAGVEVVYRTPKYKLAVARNLRAAATEEALTA
jgi:NAD(P)H-nitrite reductase large subunit